MVSFYKPLYFYAVQVNPGRARRVWAGSESENLRADVLWLRVRANSNLIIIGLSSEFHGKCVEFDSHRLQVIENSISCLRNDYPSRIRRFH